MRDSMILGLVFAATLAGCGSRESVPRGAESRIPPANIAQSATDAESSPVTESRPVETQIMDERGFGQPMVAARGEIPSGWKTRGGVNWDRSSDCVTNHMRLNWLATSPDGRRALELMPGLSWQLAGTDIPMNPCPPLAIRDTRQFLELVSKRYPAVRVLGFRDRPDLAPPPQPINGARAQTMAGELLIAYPSNGAEVRELLTASLNVTEIQGNVAIGSPVVLAYRVTGAEPDAAFSDRFMKSLKLDAQWMERSQQVAMQFIEQVSMRQRQEIDTWHAGEMARINARGMADRAQIRSQTQREVSQIYSNIWANSQATDERIQRRTLEGIGEYNTYADPAAGGVVRESTHYNRVIRTDDGNFISTNDPYLDPAGSQELERIP